MFEWTYEPQYCSLPPYFIFQNRILAFSKLGDFLSQFSTQKIEKKENISFNDLFFDGFLHQIKLAQENNSWFTKENILFALESWGNSLKESNLTHYTSSLKEIQNPKKDNQ